MALFSLPSLLHFCGSHPLFAGNDLPFRHYSISTSAAHWRQIKPCRHPGHPVRRESDDHFRDVAKKVGDAVLQSLTVFYDPLNGHKKIPYSLQNENSLQIEGTVSALFCLPFRVHSGRHSRTIRTLPGSLPRVSPSRYSSNRCRISAGAAGEPSENRASRRSVVRIATLVSPESASFRA